MRVYISVDMEGIAGVVHEDQTNPVDPRCASEYNRFRQLMTREANAAVEGAIEGGATSVLVNDSHWTMRNLLAEELHPAAELISGGPKTWSMMEGIERGWDLAAFIGYHAKAGTGQAILDHTYTSRILDVRLNGLSVGEVGINAALAGTFGVPVAVVSGDQALAAECRGLLGDGVDTVVVKEAISRHAARSVAPERAQALIRDAMRNAVHQRQQGRSTARALTVPTPTTLEVDFAVTVHADHAAMVPGFRRAGPRTVAFQATAYRDLFRAFRTMFNLGGLD
ncbi:MAG TPA: M55 family metallopeptidase [Gemmatimonadales bacterium]|nr:M55 family metallopeptidase [Gemmatimonadales bacterium]